MCSIRLRWDDFVVCGQKGVDATMRGSGHRPNAETGEHQVHEVVPMLQVTLDGLQTPAARPEATCAFYMS